MMRKSGPESGSVCLSRRTDRHGFPKNRHGYFTNPSVCPRIDGMMPATCPEKAAFGTVRRADNLRDGVQYAGTEETGVLDRSPIRICPEGHGEPKESGPESGSVCLSRRSDRHGFLKNRHGYFTNPSICPRIDRIKPAACPEKAAFGTVWTGDRRVDRTADHGIWNNPVFLGVSV